MTPLTAPARMVELEIDGQAVRVFEGSTILDACTTLGIDTPTLCYGETLRPANVCRVCVVELEGARVLAPACSRKVEPGMVVKTDSERVRLSRKLVLELLASSVDLSIAPSVPGVPRALRRAARALRPAGAAGSGPRPQAHRASRRAGRADRGDGRTRRRRSTTSSTSATTRSASSATSASTPAASSTRTRSPSPSPDAASTPASRPSTSAELPESACVYCGNCIAVCPTGALIFKSEYDMRADGTWDESEQTADATRSAPTAASAAT